MAYRDNHHVVFNGLPAIIIECRPRRFKLRFDDDIAASFFVESLDEVFYRRPDGTVVPARRVKRGDYERWWPNGYQQPVAPIALQGRRRREQQQQQPPLDSRQQPLRLRLRLSHLIWHCHLIESKNFNIVLFLHL